MEELSTTQPVNKYYRVPNMWQALCKAMGSQGTSQTQCLPSWPFPWGHPHTAKQRTVRIRNESWKNKDLDRKSNYNGNEKKKKQLQDIRAGHPHKLLTASYNCPTAPRATRVPKCTDPNGAGLQCRLPAPRGNRTGHNTYRQWLL